MVAIVKLGQVLRYIHDSDHWWLDCESVFQTTYILSCSIVVPPLVPLHPVYANLYVNKAMNSRLLGTLENLRGLNIKHQLL